MIVLAMTFDPRAVAPETLRDATGDTRPSRRRVWLSSDRMISCPSGHLIAQRQLSLHELTLRCNHHESSGRSARCGRCVYVITDWRGEGDDTLTLHVEVTEDEIKRMRRMPMRAKLAYLGLSQEVRRAD